jgi:hypothetical protein
LPGGESFACEKTFFVNKPLRAIAAEPVKNRLLEMPFSSFLMAHLLKIQNKVIAFYESEIE